MAFSFTGFASPGARDISHWPTAIYVSPTLGPVYDVKSVSKIPKAKFKPHPQYPFRLRSAGITGEATVKFVITKTGSLAELSVVSASEPEFGVASMACVSKWRFAPGEIDGVRVNCEATMPMTYDLK